MRKRHNKVRLALIDTITGKVQGGIVGFSVCHSSWGCTGTPRGVVALLKFGGYGATYKACFCSPMIGLTRGAWYPIRHIGSPPFPFDHIAFTFKKFRRFP